MDRDERDERADRGGDGDETFVTPLDLAPSPSWRAYLMRAVCRIMVGCYMHLQVRGELPEGGALIAFNHLSWVDPIFVIAAHPLRPRLYLFGPREADMRVGFRNRLITWSRIAVPFKPDRRDLVRAVRRVESVIGIGGHLAIAAEGRIHAGERRVETLNPGIALLARRSGAPVVPLAINGTSWLAFGRTARIQYGSPLALRPGETDEAFLARVRAALLAMVADAPEPGPPTGRLGLLLSELFNDWPGGRGVRPPIPADDGITNIDRSAAAEVTSR